MDNFIIEIQTALIAFGYQPGPIDGICGRQTRAAISNFQRDHGLEADGLVGPLTQRFLLMGEQMDSLEKKKTDQLTAHFNREEFRCCCQNRYCNGFPAEMAQHLLKCLEATRLALNSEIVVTSGLRCTLRNAEVGGIPNSKHLRGWAVDCYAPGLAIERLAQAAERNGLTALLYQDQGFCHLEI